MTASTHNPAQEPRKRRGRPPGSTIPPERYKGVVVRANVTAAQADKWARLGGAEWLRQMLDRARVG